MNQWIASADGALYVHRFKMTRGIRPNVTAQVSFENGLYRVHDVDGSVFVARKSRINHHVGGTRGRLANLNRQYLSAADLVRPGDVVIDCGANIGEFSMICAGKGAKVIAFEPDPREFAALSMNAESVDITPVHAALWKEDGSMPFYDANDTGDSSLIEPAQAARQISVRTIRLDTMAELPDGPIRLVKLEAEGAEPEIVEGMTKMLGRIDYIVADLGPERGVRMECTLPQVTNALLGAGFKISQFKPARCMTLFERVGQAEDTTALTRDPVAAE